MFDIHHYFQINSPVEKVFKGISEPFLLDKWWSAESEGQPEMDAVYKLGFGPEYNWEAHVVSCQKPIEFGLRFSKADSDWLGTIVLFRLTSEGENKTSVNFHHTGWPQDNEHYRISNYCWAMYLRILKRYLEFGEEVPYENRLEV